MVLHKPKARIIPRAGRYDQLPYNHVQHDDAIHLGHSQSQGWNELAILANELAKLMNHKKQIEIEKQFTYL